MHCIDYSQREERLIPTVNGLFDVRHVPTVRRDPVEDGALALNGGHCEMAELGRRGERGDVELQQHLVPEFHRSVDRPAQPPE